MKRLTAGLTAELVCRGEITARRVAEDALERCRDVNKKLNTFIAMGGPVALGQASAVDRQISSGKTLPLAGVPLALKDDICYSGLPTTLGSPALKEFQTPYSAGAVDKLIAAGAVIVGKTNLDDFGMGSTTAASPFGPALNPWMTDRLAGSAAAAAVAAGQCLLALDSDSGGVMRQGAAENGILGLRPTAGRVTRYGLHAHAPSFGQIGICAVSADDLRLALGLLSGFDQRDAATAACPENTAGADLPDPRGPLTVGLPLNLFAGIDPEQKGIVESFCSDLRERGYKTTDLHLPLFTEALLSYYVIALAEASSNLSRFEGIRFGSSSDEAGLEKFYTRTRRNTFGPESRRRSIFGAFLLSAGSYDLYYRQALKIVGLVQEEFRNVFKQCSVLLLPAVSSSHLPAGEEHDFLDLYERDFYCAPVSMAGLPALCLPAGLCRGLPVGLQLVGPRFGEELLLKICSTMAPELERPPGWLS